MSFEQLESTVSSSYSGKFLIGLICALILAGGLAYGYSQLSLKHNRENNPLETKVTHPLPSPEVEVFENEARLKGKDALISGMVVNKSKNELNNLSVLLELVARNQSQLKENKIIALQTSSLKPTQESSYQLLVPWSKFSSARIVAIKSGEKIVCQPGPQSCLKHGTSRPRETTPNKLPTVTRKAPAVVPPKRKSNSDEVINTPETADPY